MAVTPAATFGRRSSRQCLLGLDRGVAVIAEPLYVFVRHLRSRHRPTKERVQWPSS